jgi:hypothetical protein
VNPRVHHFKGCFNNLAIGPAISLTQPVGGTIATEGTVITAPGGKVQEAIKEDLVPEITVPQLSGRGKKLPYFFSLV